MHWKKHAELLAYDEKLRHFADMRIPWIWRTA